MNEDIVHVNNDMLMKVELMNVNQDKNKLKKVNGLKFTVPALSIVLANAIGRGAIAYCSQFIFSPSEREVIWIVRIH